MKIINILIKERKMIIFINISFGSLWSLVGIATDYELDGLAIESWLGRGFWHPSRLTLVPNQPHVQWIPDLFPGGKSAGVWRWPPIPIWRWGWRKNRAITLLPLCVFVAGYRVNFVFMTCCLRNLIVAIIGYVIDDAEKLLCPCH